MKKKKDFLDITIEMLDLIRVIVIGIIVALLIYTFGFRKEEIVGNSMYPLLKDGESVIANVAASYLTSIERFDVVVVKQGNELWIKRVIGLPNETISYQQDQLFIDGKKVEEPFLDAQYVKETKKTQEHSLFTENMETVTLKEGEYFLIGDNRPSSLDSRNVQVGPFRREQIIAKGVFVYSPISKARYISGGK